MNHRQPMFLLAGFFALSIAACASTASDAQEPHRGDRLKPCPDSPNCVSSQATADRHAIAPLMYGSARQAAYKVLLDVLTTAPGAKVITNSTEYIHAEFKSKLFGFVDDVEFYFTESDGLIHVRSASRTGYYDFGANRKRVEMIREKFNQASNEALAAEPNG